MLRTVLFTSITTLLLTFSSYTPVAAIPSCPAGTLSDYLGFGTSGCQFSSLTFKDFSYSGTNLGGDPGPAGQVAVQPFSASANLNGLTFTSEFTQPLPLGGWKTVQIGFEVAGPGIVQDTLHLNGVVSSPGPGVVGLADVGESAVPGGSLSTFVFSDCGLNPSRICRDSDSISFAPVALQDIAIFGEGSIPDGLAGFSAGFATTPEPTTLLLLGSGLTALGLMARRRRLK